jgi:hypothetical protein
VHVTKKIRSLTGWRPPNIVDWKHNAVALDNASLRRAVAQNLPGFIRLGERHQDELIRSVGIALLTALVEYKNGQSRPLIPDMRRSLTKLSRAIEGVSAMRASLDLATRLNLTSAAGRLKIGDGFQFWTDFDRFCELALASSHQALAELKGRREKHSSLAGLNSLIARLIDLFEMYGTPITRRPNSRSNNRGGFLSFAIAALQCVQGLEHWTQTQVDYTIRHYDPASAVLRRGKYYRRVSA